MTQASPTIGANKNGLNYRQEDNDGKKALMTHHKGSSAPSYAESGTIWIDDSSTPWKMKFYDGSDWIVMAEINATTNAINFYQGTAANRLLTHATAGGTATAYTLAPTPALSAYTAGQVVVIKPTAANTGAVTISVSGLSAKSIKMQDGSNPPPNVMLASGVYILVYDGTNFILTNPSKLTGDVTPGISGFLISNNASDTVNDIDIATGICSDTTNTTIIKTTSTYIKRLDASWSAGSGNGGRDTGAIADGTWFVHAIYNPETSDTDFLFSLSRTAPTLPTGYTLFRCVGIVMRVSGGLVQYAGARERGTDIVYGYATPVLDINVSNLGSSGASYTITSPANGNFCAVIGQGIFSHINAGVMCNVYGSTNIFGTLGSPSSTTSPLACCVTAVSGQFVSTGQMEMITSDSPTIRAASSASNTTFKWSSLGFVFYRSK